MELRPSARRIGLPTQPFPVRISHSEEADLRRTSSMRANTLSRTLLVVGLLLTTAGLNLAHAGEDDWAGYYVGLDAQDGSIDRLSIVPNGDGTFDIRMVSTGISLCDPANPAGVIVATGRLVDGQLVRENVVLRCVGSEEMILKDSTYTRDEDTGILTLPAPDNGRQMQYHPASGDD